MGLLQSFRNIFNRPMPNNSFLQQIYGYLTGGSIITINDNPRQYIREGYAKNPHLYSVVDFIAQKASKVPFVLYKKLPDGTREQIQSHPLLDLLEQPNPYQAKSEYFRQLFSYLLITGNSYEYAPRLSSGKTIELWVMPADQVEIISGGWTKPVQAYTIQWTGSTQQLPAEDVNHTKYPNLEFDVTGQNLYGMSPVKAALKVLEKSNTGYESSKNQISNMGGDGMLFPDFDPQVGGLDDNTIKMLQERIDAKFNNPSTKGKVMIASSKTGYINFGRSAVEMEVIEQAKFDLEDFCRIYHVPSILFGQENSSFNNLNTARKQAYTDAILPIVEMWVDRFNAWIVRSYGSDLVLDYDTSGIEEMQQDMATLVGWLKQATWIDLYDKELLRGGIPDENLRGYYEIGGRIMTFEQLTEQAKLSNLDITL